jgi:hypothetical protein
VVVSSTSIVEWQLLLLLWLPAFLRISMPLVIATASRRDNGVILFLLLELELLLLLLFEVESWMLLALMFAQMSLAREFLAALLSLSSFSTGSGSCSRTAANGSSSFADEVLLARMHACVHDQVGRIDEATGAERTGEGTVARVKTLMGHWKQ